MFCESSNRAAAAGCEGSIGRGRGRFLTEAFEVANDVGVLTADHVLVPESGGPLRRARCEP